MRDEKYLTVDGKQYDVSHEQLHRVIEADLSFSPWAEKLLRMDDRLNSEPKTDE